MSNLLLAFLLVALPATPTMLEAQTLHDEQQLWDRTTDVSVMPLQSEPATRVWSYEPHHWDVYIAAQFQPQHHWWAYAIIECETAGTYDPQIRNYEGSGATGLFQVMPFWVDPSRHGNYSHIGTDLTDPHTNIAVAARIFYEHGAHHWACNRILGLP